MGIKIQEVYLVNNNSWRLLSEKVNRLLPLKKLFDVLMLLRIKLGCLKLTLIKLVKLAFLPSAL